MASQAFLHQDLHQLDSNGQYDNGVIHEATIDKIEEIFIYLSFEAGDKCHYNINELRKVQRHSHLLKSNRQRNSNTTIDTYYAQPHYKPTKEEIIDALPYATLSLTEFLQSFQRFQQSNPSAPVPLPLICQNPNIQQHPLCTIHRYLLQPPTKPLGNDELHSTVIPTYVGI